MHVSVIGLLVLLAYKLIFISEFLATHHLDKEWRVLLNLLGLLLGFSILSKHFEESHIPKILPKILPHDWKGGLFLLCLIFILSSFLDNIAAAIIGGTIAHVVYRGKVHIGFLAAIIAASNAGGAGSVLGDTTTTLMWIGGVSPLKVLHAYIGSIGAFAFFAVFASIQQHRLQPVIQTTSKKISIDYKRLIIVFLILILTIITNWKLDFPAVGVWIGIFLGATFCKTPWREIKHSLSGTIFLMALVSSASLMPVDKLHPASWISTLILGFVSAIFDNIPLTKLCLDQGGYDWGMLAYAVGYGGSMIWFGSSAGVALSNMYPEIRSSWNYLKSGWHVAIGYVIGFFILYTVWGWNP